MLFGHGTHVIRLVLSPSSPRDDLGHACVQRILPCGVAAVAVASHGSRRIRVARGFSTVRESIGRGSSAGRPVGRANLAVWHHGGPRSRQAWHAPVTFETELSCALRPRRGSRHLPDDRGRRRMVTVRAGLTLAVVAIPSAGGGRGSQSGGGGSRRRTYVNELGGYRVTGAGRKWTPASASLWPDPVRSTQVWRSHDVPDVATRYSPVTCGRTSGQANNAATEEMVIAQPSTRCRPRRDAARPPPRQIAATLPRDVADVNEVTRLLPTSKLRGLSALERS